MNEKNGIFWLGWGWTFSLALALELLEELLEEGIAIGITFAISKAVSALLVVTLAQSAKLVIKKIVKTKIYKGGNDKMKFIKTAFAWLFANKKSILGTVTGAFSGVATAIALNAGMITELPVVMLLGFNITPIIAGLLIFAGVEIGIVGKGFEFITTFKARIEAEKQLKAQKAEVAETERLKKLALAEIEADKKAQAEKQRIEQERIASEQKAKAEADKIAKMKAELLNEQK